MKSSFPGFPQEGLDFLRDLKANNDREWFTPRKAIYDEKLRAPMLALVEAVHAEIARFAPDYVGEPSKCLYRIYRDTRFAKDKTPYKTHVGALLWRNGTEKNEGPAYYFGVSPECVEIAGGLYSPDPDALHAVRSAIAADPDGFRATFETPKVKKLLGELKGEKLSRLPRGFDPEHPAAEYLKYKRWVLYTELDPSLATGPKVLKEIVSRIEVMAPFAAYLSGSLKSLSKKRRQDEHFLR